MATEGAMNSSRGVFSETLLPDEAFEKFFSALTGHKPFPWQTALYERLVQGEIPARCDIPTGLGKTAVVAVWLIALAHRPDKLVLHVLQGI